MDKIHIIDRDWETNQAEDFIDKLRKKKDSIVVFYTHTQEFTETNKDIDKGIVLWHIPSKKDIKNLKEYCDINQERILFIGKSGLSDIRKEAEKAKLFKLVVGSFDTTKIKSCFRLDKSPLDFNSIYNCLSGESKKAEIDKTIYQILHLFLPLDIDMQTLEILKDDAGKIEKYLWGDKHTDIEGMFESREGDEHYRQKLYDLWHLLGKQDYLTQIDKSTSSEIENLMPINNPSLSLQKLAGFNNRAPKESQIYKFFESIDTAKKDDMDVTAEDLCKPFNLEVEVSGKKEKIKSFHNWYCALASCMREAEGSEEQ